MTCPGYDDFYRCVCELPAGHRGLHRGTLTWLAQAPTPAIDEGEVSE